MSQGSNRKEPFALQVGYDQPELLGARWWLEGAIELPPATSRATRLATTDESRRLALKMLFGVGGALALSAFALTRCSSTSTRGIDHASLDLQRTRGLMTGSDIQKFPWLDTTDQNVDGELLDRGLLNNLTTTLLPTRADLVPFYVPTLFQSPQALGSEELVRSATCVNSASMRVAYGRGEAMRELVQLAEHPDKWSIVIDLPGPDSVAFAAALQPIVDTVFTFDNWPHPRGVVPSHQTLGAVLFHHPRFVAARTANRLTPVFVLDRNRLASYQDQPQQFDNRYRAKLPTADALRQLGIERVLYVVPEGAAATELDDLNERFVEYREAGVEVRLLGVGDFQPVGAPAAQAAAGTASRSGTGTRYYWGGGPSYHYWFWNHYGWASRPGPVTAVRPPTSAFGGSYRPTVRRTSRQSLTQLGRTTTTERSSGSSGGSRGRSSGGYGG